MKLLASIILITLLAASNVQAACPQYLDTSMRKLHSKSEVNFCDSFAGKPMLIINTASHCGYTPQFKGLESLHQQYKDRGLVVAGFASDDFRQEDDSEEKAAEICYKNYGVTFTMLAPSHVRGDNANPVFKALAEQSKAPNWNFNKYLVDAEGNVVEHWGSSTKPQSDKIGSAIESVLR